MSKIRGVPVLLLTVAGRNTGVEHTTPIADVADAGGFVVVGSAGGAVWEPQWFRNLRTADRAVIEVGPERLAVSVSITGPEEHAMLWHRLLARAPFFGDYQAKSSERIR